MYIGPARTLKEVELARSLAAQVLLGHIESGESAARKEFLWGGSDAPRMDHVVIATPATGEVCAVVRLVTRTLRHASDAFRVAGISSVAVAPAWRNRGIGRKIMEECIRQAKTLGYELTVLFARRAADHFYPQFDIWGLASYTNLQMPAVPAAWAPADFFGFRPFVLDDQVAVQSWYGACYAKCSGWFERNEKQWSYLLKSADYREIKIWIAENAADPVGYFVTRADRVIEFGVPNPIYARATLHRLGVRQLPLKIDLPRRHSLLAQIVDADFTVASRRCEFGGHMVGVLNRRKACARLAARIERSARETGLTAQHEEIDGVFMSWDGTSAKVGLALESEAQALGCRTTARLLGVSLLGENEGSILAPAESLDFLSWDEF